MWHRTGSLPQHLDFSPKRRQQTGDRLEQRRFPRAVHSDQREGLPGPQFQVNPFHSRLGLVTDSETPGARALAGRVPLEPGQTISNSIGLRSEMPLWFLADIFAIPRLFVLANVFSVGDVLIALGSFYLIQRAMVRPPITRQTTETVSTDTSNPPYI